MITEPSRSEIIVLFTTNAIASMCCSQIHKTVYFLMGLTFWAMHFGHYVVTFSALSFLSLSRLIEWQPLPPFGKLWPLVLAEAMVSLATCLVHTGGSDGAVHSIRVTDFAVTLLILLLARRFVDENFYSSRTSGYTALLVIIAISSSLAWVEPILYLEYVTYFAWPIIILSTSFHFMLCFQLSHQYNVSPIMLCLHVCGYTSVLLCPFAIFFTTDTFSEGTQDLPSSWETIDYVMILMSCIFVCCMVVSKYMLLCKLTPETYAVTRHAKYLMGSYGQWLLQDMAHFTPFSMVGKGVATLSILYYSVKRWNEKKSVGIDLLSKV